MMRFSGVMAALAALLTGAVNWWKGRRAVSGLEALTHIAATTHEQRVEWVDRAAAAISEGFCPNGHGRLVAGGIKTDVGGLCASCKGIWTFNDKFVEVRSAPGTDPRSSRAVWARVLHWPVP